MTDASDEARTRQPGAGAAPHTRATLDGSSPGRVSVVDGSARPVLRARGLVRSFGDVHALRGVDLSISSGEVVGLLGPNGAGKTTLVRIIATVLRPDDGEFAVCGIDASTDAASVRAHIGLAGQFASVDQLLTGRENLELIGRLYGISPTGCAGRAADLLTALGLEHAADRRVSTYSGGMRRRLDLGATLIGEPALLLLDEPTAGLDPWSRNELWELVEAIAERGTSVLLTSQHLDEVERLAHRVVVLRDGQVIADDHPRRLQRRVGGQILDIRGDTSALVAIGQALEDRGLEPRIDRATSRVTAPTDAALPGAIDVAQHLVAAEIEPTELALRMPSLEEAFLALTGATSTDERDVVEAGERSRLGDATKPELTRSVTSDVAAVTGRYWKHLMRTPQSLFFATVQPLLFVVGLQAVFGDLVANVLGENYIQFLLPGVIVMNLILAAGVTGVGLATDLKEGIIDRFRSLPISRSAVLIGRTATDLARNAIAVAIMILAGFALGFRLEGGPAGGVAAVAVALLFGYAATWVFAAVGLAVKDPQAANFIGFVPVLLFVYLSSAWVPIETMSGAVQGFARYQPVNATIESVRGLANGTDVTSQTLQSIAWSILLITTFTLIATRQFAKATS